MNSSHTQTVLNDWGAVSTSPDGDALGERKPLDPLENFLILESRSETESSIRVNEGKPNPLHSSISEITFSCFASRKS